MLKISKPTILRTLLLSLALLILAGFAAGDTAERWKLPRRLQEVSGIAMSVDGRIFIHNDEKAIIYEFDSVSGDISSILKIGDPALRDDFEGLAIIDSDFYLLTSSGYLHKVQDGLSLHEAVVSSQVFDTGLADICEAEGLSSHNRKLFIVCKTNYNDVDKDHLLIYRFDPGTQLTYLFLRIAYSELGFLKVSASGLAVKDNRIYVVAASQRLLLVITHQGEFLEHRWLAKKYHRQTEGIGVTDEGVLILADEGGKRGRITVYASINDIP